MASPAWFDASLSEMIINLDERLQSIHRVGLDFEGESESLLQLLDWDFPASTRVAIVYCPCHDPKRVRQALETIVSLLGLEQQIRTLRTLLLKPVLVEARRPDEHITTHPVLLGELVRLLKEISGDYADILVAEGSGHERDTENLLIATGTEQVLETESVRFVDLNVEDLETHSQRDKTYYQSFRLPKLWFAADYRINLPRLKTHHRTGVSLGMKSLFGCVPGSIYGFPKNILHWLSTPRSIVSLADVLSPELTIVDGIVGIEGNGPLNGKLRCSKVLIAGTSVASVDLVSASLAGCSPLLIPQFWYALLRGLLKRMELVGDVGLRLDPFEAPTNIPWLTGSIYKSREHQINLLHALLSEGDGLRHILRSRTGP
jgi:uncharacterized protein (DUF362 family)